ncbi:MAG: cytochrome P450 [Chloroflexi bacterium]|nr:cytochrome P450 [Chloroflexota bacterium]MBP8057049.1 cytochrome P450 [Chloroflexota bacterium]
MSPSNSPSADHCPLPTADATTGLQVLRAFLAERSPLAALKVMQQTVGDAFRITLPRFDPAVLVGPANNRHILVSGRADFLWRSPDDPVAHLLRQGVLVTDGPNHDHIRAVMDPALHRRQVGQYVAAFWQLTDSVTSQWGHEGRADMLVEMRKVALLILVNTLFGADFQPDMPRLWRPILRAIAFIGPGAWIVWPQMPRPGYARDLALLDAYLYDLIARRRQQPGGEDNLLARLAAAPGFDDNLIRDQLLTMLIAGHDTSTALLAWALFLLGQHPAIMAQVRAEVDRVLGTRPPTLEALEQLPLLDQVIKETLRLYPPIHVGNRRANGDITVRGYEIPDNTRLMMSIYLSHRHPQHWVKPDAFHPERFAHENQEKVPPFTYIPFGGGPRNCMGASFAQIEARVVLARLLQTFTLVPEKQRVYAHMGATLEPHPGVWMRLQRRG